MGGGRVRCEELDPAIVRDLARVRAYPGDPSARRRVEHVQTHLSHVFLTGERVYKIHKSVDLGFLDFRARRARNADSLREVRLNRRLSPDVYLGVAPVERSARGWRVGAVGEALARRHAGLVPEHCVVMRRLPAGRDLRTLLERGRAGAREIDALARLLARFHATSRARDPVRARATAWFAAVRAPIEANLVSLEIARARAGAVARALSAHQLATLRRETEAALARLAPRLLERLRAGRPVDGHGDLHLEHVWIESPGASPLLVDCLEFRDDFRRVDPASEVAFLAMDLAYRGHARLAERFLRSYAEAADDFDLYTVVDLFTSYRAAVRAKVAAIAADDPAIAPRQRKAAAQSVQRHVRLAVRALRPRAPGAIVATCGIVGTGKSSVARALADALGAVVISSDRVRKAESGRVAYGERAKDEVYDAMIERAETVARAGRTVVLDATFDTRTRRAKLRTLAERLGTSASLVETRCAAATTRARLAVREATGRDPSDAGPAYHALHRRRFVAPREWPRARRFVVQTDCAWKGEIRRIATSLRSRSLPRARRPRPLEWGCPAPAQGISAPLSPNRRPVR